MTVNPQSVLSSWQGEYCVPGEILWNGYAELGGSVKSGYRMGRCDYTRYVKADGSVGYRSTIYLDDGMRNAPDFFQMSVLYHEFSHARAYNEDGVNNDHDATFRKYRREKPAYWLGDMLMKWIGWIWCRRGSLYLLRDAHMAGRWFSSPRTQGGPARDLSEPLP